LHLPHPIALVRVWLRLESSDDICVYIRLGNRAGRIRQRSAANKNRVLRTTGGGRTNTSASRYNHIISCTFGRWRRSDRARGRWRRSSRRCSERWQTRKGSWESCSQTSPTGVSSRYIRVNPPPCPAPPTKEQKRQEPNDVGGGGPAPQAATRVAASTPPLKHLDIFQGAPLRLPKRLSDQFPVRVCSCPLCSINRL